VCHLANECRPFARPRKSCDGRERHDRIEMIDRFARRASLQNAACQLSYGFRLHDGDGISMNKPLAAHYFKLSADH
jgi:TPR repeat protein